MTHDEDGFDEDLMRDRLTTYFATRRIVGDTLDEEQADLALRAIRSLPDAADRTPRQARFAEAALSVIDGLDAAAYHAGRAQSLEAELLGDLADHYRRFSRLENHTVSARTPRLAHEYVAFLNAARRTMEYVSRSVGRGFGVDSGRIKSLASAVQGCKPPDVAEQIAVACERIDERFDYLLSRDGRRSARDVAAHWGPVSPAYLLVVVHSDEVLIELRGSEPGPLRDLDGGGLDLARMRSNPNRLSPHLQTALTDLLALCIELLDLGAQAASRDGAT